MQLFKKQPRRVLQFIDSHENIPPNSEYLFTKEIQLPLQEDDAQRAYRVIHGTEPPQHPIFVHFYEVNLRDYEKMVKAGWHEKDFLTKIREHHAWLISLNPNTTVIDGLT